MEREISHFYPIRPEESERKRKIFCFSRQRTCQRKKIFIFPKNAPAQNNFTKKMTNLEKSERFFFAVTMGEAANFGKSAFLSRFRRRNRNGKEKSFVFLGKELANAKNIFIFPKKAPDQNNFPIFD